MSNETPVQSLTDAGFGMGGSVRGVGFMMITMTITTGRRAVSG